MTDSFRRVGDLCPEAIQQSLELGEFALLTGSLTTRIRSAFPDVAKFIYTLYYDHPFEISPEFADFHVEVKSPNNLRRWFRPQTEFLIDGDPPFEPLPRDQAPAMLEWGLNWSIAASCHQWFTIHAAALERDGYAVILPAPPGSGKSTLCATLAFRGWRLLSDELTLIEPDTKAINALARPINLKNASIDLIRKFEPNTFWSPITFDTSKGRVAHLRPPSESVRRMHEKATPRWIVFPKYEPDAEPVLTQRSKTATFMPLAENAFNYSTLGRTGFDVVTGLLDRCDCYDLTYSRLEDALEVFDWIAKTRQ